LWVTRQCERDPPLNQVDEAATHSKNPPKCVAAPFDSPLLRNLPRGEGHRARRVVVKAVDHHKRLSHKELLLEMRRLLSDA
jgi:hypothetical protein